MATRYRIVEERGAVYVEQSYRFLWLTLWHRNREYYSGSHQGRSHGNGPYTNYKTVERAKQYIITASGLDSRYVWPGKITEYTGQPFDPGPPPCCLYR